jgi:8-oxo-dGTP pyrophosphatase MutT (NUDIX family)
VAADAPEIAQECVEGYLFHTPPLSLLLFRRPPNRGQIWVPVSGKVEPKDRDFEAALRRELAEETGVRDPKRVFSLGWEVVFEDRPGVHWRLHAFGVELEAKRSPALSPEHDEFEWVTPEEAVRRLHYPDNQAAVRRLQTCLGGSAHGSPPSL